MSLALSPAGTIKAAGDRVAVNRWLPVLREHKAGIVAELGRPVPRGLCGYATPPGVPPLGDCELARQVRSMPEGNPVPGDETILWWRVALIEPGGRTVEVDTPSGWTLGEWAAYAARYHGPGCAVTPIAPLPKPRAPVHPDEVLRTACDGVAGITPGVFRALLSPEDLADIEIGGIHPKTLHAYAESFVEGMRLGRIAALPERKEAKAGLVSGSIVITEAEIEAARKGRTVVRQEGHEVKG